MFFTMFVNGALGFATFIVILFCFGGMSTITSPLPFVQIFYGGTKSLAGATVMTCILLFMYTAATFGFLAAASRQAWAFARDNGLPLSNFLKRVGVLPDCEPANVLDRQSLRHSVVRNRLHLNHQCPLGFDQHRFFCGLQRNRFPSCGRILLLLLNRRCTDVAQTPAR